MLTPQVQEFAARSVLCWLATADELGRPNVSPKEIFAVFDSRHLVIANIASPTSARNIDQNAEVCVSFIDVFAQRGYKVQGTARNIRRDAPDYAAWSKPLVHQAGPRFPIHSVFVVQVQAVTPIIAPSYRLYPEQTTEHSQIQSAMRAYRVRPDPDNT